MIPRKIFCVGFHKTGTSSLGRALNLLEYRVAGPFGVRDPRIAERAWTQAQSRLDAYDAFQDNPWPVLFRQLDAGVPGGRFVLTVRPVDEWWSSTLNHFGGRTTPMREWIYGVGDPSGHEEQYRERYEAHNRAVLDHFADRPGDLLVLRLSEGDGWEPLCRFLEVPVPDRPFPHANRAGWRTTIVSRTRDAARRVVRR